MQVGSTEKGAGPVKNAGRWNMQTNRLLLNMNLNFEGYRKDKEWLLERNIIG